jgi:hypothetical protein
MHARGAADYFYRMFARILSSFKLELELDSRTTRSAWNLLFENHNGIIAHDA